MAVGWKEGTIPGFEIVTYTGTGVAHDIAHSLGVAPWAIFVKNLDQADSWRVYTRRGGEGDYLALDSSNAEASAATVWDNTAPDSDSFRVGTAVAVNTLNENYVAYLFAPVKGFSRFAGYGGNGNNDGPFVPTQFMPLIVLVKDAGGNYNWWLKDGVRDPDNPVQNSIYPNATGTAEDTNYNVQFLSSGFKLETNQNGFNRNGNGHRFFAWGIYPQQAGRAR
jgi:hypothetical protein